MGRSRTSGDITPEVRASVVATRRHLARTTGCLNLTQWLSADEWYASAKFCRKPSARSTRGATVIRLQLGNQQWMAPRAITMQWNSRTDRWCCSRASARVNARPYYSCRRPLLSRKSPRGRRLGSVRVWLRERREFFVCKNKGSTFEPFSKLLVSPISNPCRPCHHLAWQAPALASSEPRLPSLR